MRIALFGGEWPLTRNCLEALVAAGHEVLFVTPPLGLRRRLGRIAGRREAAVERAARRAGAAVARHGGSADCEAVLRRFRPDLICIATFPSLIPARITALAPKGAINVHPSLLPRHRGVQPLPWIYWRDDREAGVSVHRASGRFDAGPIIAQDRFPLPRGYPIEQLATDLIARSGPLLLAAIAAVEAGAPETPQDETQATDAPKMPVLEIPYEAWDVERIWHVLAGLASRHRAVLVDDRGEPVRYQTVPSYRRGLAGSPGSVMREAGGWSLQCLDGVVRLEP